METTRLLILSSSTGGGHDMRAQALRDWVALDPSQHWEVRQHQALETAHGFYRFGVWFYNFIQRHAPFLHHLYFHELELLSLFRHPRWIMGGQKFCELVREFAPHVVVSVHGSTNHGFFELVRQTLGARDVRCVTYCGELSGGYGFSRHWVNPSADLFIGAVTETAEAAQKLGMPADRNKVGGFLLRPDFYQPRLSTEQRASLARELELDPLRFILMLSTGANGALNHTFFLRALAAAGLSLQVIALCGRNEKEKQNIQAMSAHWPQLKVCALGRREDMAGLMDLADAIVTRPGTGTTSEAILRQCPLILNGMGGIMPQECITVKFCRRHHLGEVITTAKEFIRSVQRMAQHQDHRDEVRQRMQKIRPIGDPTDLLSNLRQG
jgi:processive 1,2-diacylglycerol beta-glucosyltransferase